MFKSLIVPNVITPWEMGDQWDVTFVWRAGRWQIAAIYAFNDDGTYLGEIPIWSIDWITEGFLETKAKQKLGRPHP